AHHTFTYGWLPRIPSVDQAVGSANGCRRNGRKSSPIPTLNNAHATCAPVRLSTASTDCVLATPNAWRSTSPRTHHRIAWPTRNTSTSFGRRGGGRAADRVAFGGSTGWNEQPQSLRSPRTHT